MTARLALLLAALAVTLPATAQTHTGTLQQGDATLSSGEFVDRYEVRVNAGDEVRVEMTSTDFDPYLILVEPGGEQEDNDDCTDGDLQRSCATIRATSAGVVRVSATSYQPGENGRYRVEITTGGRGGRPAQAAGGWGSRAGDRSGRQAEATALGGDRQFDGELRNGDETIRSGEFVDAYEVAVEAGRTVTVEMTSRDFDTYLILTDPDGDQEDNDDCTSGETTRSCVTVTPRRSGTLRVLATSYQPGETGRYTVEVTGGGGVAGRPGTPSRPGTRPSTAAGSAAGRVETGELARGDETIQSGEFADRFSFTGTGGPVVVDLRADGFDPYLIVSLPGGEQLDNDDYEGALDRSLLVVDTEPGARYTALVTSYRPGETGRYSLSIDGGAAAPTAGRPAPGRPAAPGIRTESGRLAAGDETLRSGEFVDSYSFHGIPGQRVTIDLTSDDFDTYLVVDPPAGEPVQDDDGGGRIGHSQISLDLTEAGTYSVLVTSYRPGETGSYTLAMDLSERFGRPTASAPDAPSAQRPTSSARPTSPSAPTSSYRPPTRRVADYTLAETFRGSLDAQDTRLSSGEFTEIHTFDGDAGEPVRIEMTSEAFDTYLIVTSPSGEQVDNDDFEGSQRRSVVEFVMPEDGRYRVTATSYRPGETGAYALRISQADALAPDPAAFDRIVGVFAGVSDYERPGLPDLQWTAQDAEVVRNAMIEAGMRPEDGILLTDQEATVANVRRAFDRLAATTDDRTLFVFFFSGHGAQVPVRSAQRSDPDGTDETIELYDGAILDDEMDAMLSRLPAGRQLIVLDACFSGGFAKDVITAPGRMGLFSSEEDVVSAVAVKFEAGGYLAHFFADGVAARHADGDGNGAITPLELSQYIHDRYTSDVRGTGRELIVARDTRPEHQRFVVDRGSLGLYDSLFFVP